MVETGPLLFGYHLVQWIMMLGGVSVFAVGILMERYS